MSTIATKDGTEIYYNDWARASPSSSATAGRSARTPSRIRCFTTLKHKVNEDLLAFIKA